MSENIILADGRKLGSLKVVDLKKELEALGLDKNGLKKDLVQRLADVRLVINAYFFKISKHFKQTCVPLGPDHQKRARIHGQPF